MTSPLAARGLLLGGLRGVRRRCRVRAWERGVQGGMAWEDGVGYGVCR